MDFLKNLASAVYETCVEYKIGTMALAILFLFCATLLGYFADKPLMYYAEFFAPFGLVSSLIYARNAGALFSSRDPAAVSEGWYAEQFWFHFVCSAVGWAFLTVFVATLPKVYPGTISGGYLFLVAIGMLGVTGQLPELYARLLNLLKK